MRDNAAPQLQVPLGLMMFTGLGARRRAQVAAPFCRRRGAAKSKTRQVVARLINAEGDDDTKIGWRYASLQESFSRDLCHQGNRKHRS